MSAPAGGGPGLASGDPGWARALPTPVGPRAELDEGLLGLLLRADLANGWPAGTTLGLAAPGATERGLLRRRYAAGGGLDPGTLAALLAQPPTAIDGATYRPALLALYGPGGASGRLLGLPAPFRVCPRCVREAALLPRALALAPLGACPRHGALLAHRCRCGAALRPLGRGAPPFRCAACGLPWAAIEPAAAAPGRLAREAGILALYDVFLAAPAPALLARAQSTIGALLRAGGRTRLAFGPGDLPGLPRCRDAAGRHPVGTLVALLHRLGVGPDDLRAIAAAPPRSATRSCGNRRCPAYGRAGEDVARLDGHHLGRQEWYCARCGARHLGDRLYATTDLFPYEPGEGPPAARIARHRARLLGWAARLDNACVALREAGEPVSTAAAFARASLPRAGYLRAPGLGLVAIVARHAAAQEAALPADPATRRAARAQMHKRREGPAPSGLGCPGDRRRPEPVARPSDVDDAAWALLEPLIPPRLRPPDERCPHKRRRIVDALRYRAATRCPWKALPADYPPGPTALHYLRTWQRAGVWDRALEALPAPGPAGHSAGEAGARRALEDIRRLLPEPSPVGPPPTRPTGPALT